MVKAMAIGAGLMLAACGEKPGAGGLTEEDNRGLNEAAEMLDTSPDDQVADDDTVLGNGDEPVAVEEPAANEATANGSN